MAQSMWTDQPGTLSTDIKGLGQLQELHSVVILTSNKQRNLNSKSREFATLRMSFTGCHCPILNNEFFFAHHGTPVLVLDYQQFECYSEDNFCNLSCLLSAVKEHSIYVSRHQESLFPEFSISLHVKCKANAFTIDTHTGLCQHQLSRQFSVRLRRNLKIVIPARTI